MKRNGGAAATGIAELFMGTALPYLGKSKSYEDCDDLGWFEYWDVTHGLSHSNVLHPDEFSIEFWLAFFKKHGDDFLKIAVKLIKRFTLRMRTRKAGNETDEQSCLRATFDNG